MAIYRAGNALFERPTRRKAPTARGGMGAVGLGRDCGYLISVHMWTPRDPEDAALCGCPCVEERMRQMCLSSVDI